MDTDAHGCTSVPMYKPMETTRFYILSWTGSTASTDHVLCSTYAMYTISILPMGTSCKQMH
jgi:hypothetical protein